MVSRQILISSTIYYFYNLKLCSKYQGIVERSRVQVQGVRLFGCATLSAFVLSVYGPLSVWSSGLFGLFGLFGHLVCLVIWSFGLFGHFVCLVCLVVWSIWSV